jgi:hypothetical protein
MSFTYDFPNIKMLKKKADAYHKAFMEYTIIKNELIEQQTKMNEFNKEIEINSKNYEEYKLLYIKEKLNNDNYGLFYYIEDEIIIEDLQRRLEKKQKIIDKIKDELSFLR